MDIENRIRSRIEAILVNDARNQAELTGVSLDEEPLDGESPESDPLGDERNLYQRIINSYRNAISEVNSLLEENVGFLSGVYRIVESIKGKRDFEEICSHVVNCVLDDFGAEYCSIVLFDGPTGEAGQLCLEGIREDRRLLRIHTEHNLLGNSRLEEVIAGIVAEAPDCLNIRDVYREPRFDSVDLPAVVRSLICLPIARNGMSDGVLLLSHSIPCYFNDNHLRVLKILASIIAHLMLLTKGNEPKLGDEVKPKTADQDVFSVVLLSFGRKDSFGRTLAIDRESMRQIRQSLYRALQGNESVLLHRESELLVVLPGTSADLLPSKVCRLRQAFREWKGGPDESCRCATIHLGFSTCEPGDDLSRTLEIASAVMHPDPDEEPQP
jgi:hypothetical protein